MSEYDPFDNSDHYAIMARDEGFYSIFVNYMKVPGLSEREAYEGAKRMHERRQTHDNN